MRVDEKATAAAVERYSGPSTSTTAWPGCRRTRTQQVAEDRELIRLPRRCRHAHGDPGAARFCGSCAGALAAPEALRRRLDAISQILSGEHSDVWLPAP